MALSHLRGGEAQLPCLIEMEQAEIRMVHILGKRGEVSILSSGSVGGKMVGKPSVYAS